MSLKTVFQNQWIFYTKNRSWHQVGITSVNGHWQHITEVHRVLQTGGAVGRRLDFLMQELNREANTLGSKAIDTRSTQAAVNIKVLIEQMREQVQNIE